MKLNKFKKSLKAEYNENIKEQKEYSKSRRVVLIPILLASLLVIIVSTIAVVNIVVGNSSTQSLIKEDNPSNNQDTITIDNLDKGDNLIKINSESDLSNIKTNVTPSNNNYINKGDSVSIFRTRYLISDLEESMNDKNYSKFDGKYFYYIYPLNDHLKHQLVIYDLNSNLITSREIYYKNANNYSYPAYYKIRVYENMVIVDSGLSLYIFELLNNELIIKYETYSNIANSRLIDNCYYYITYSEIKNNINNYDNLYYDGYSNGSVMYSLNKYDLKTGEIESCNILTTGKSTYMNDEYVVIRAPFITSNNNEENQIVCTGPSTIFDFTVFTIFNINLEPVCVFKVAGDLIKNTALDIKDNQFRVFTTTKDSSNNGFNNLIIFDIKEKKRLSITENNIINGRILSVKLQGDKCIAETDYSLYEIDITNINEPKVIKEYKAVDIYSIFYKINCNNENYIFKIGVGVTDSNKIMSLYKDDELNTKIGEDYVMDLDSNIFSNIISHITEPTSFTVFYLDDDYSIYFGSSTSTNKYSFYKIDVTNGNISLYKEYDVPEYTKSYIIGNKVYIPNSNGVVVADLYE